MERQIFCPKCKDILFKIKGITSDFILTENQHTIIPLCQNENPSLIDLGKGIVKILKQSDKYNYEIQCKQCNYFIGIKSKDKISIEIVNIDFEKINSNKDVYIKSSIDIPIKKSFNKTKNIKVVNKEEKITTNYRDEIPIVD